MRVRTLGLDEVDRYRAIRLEALGADPEVFASSFERERVFDDETWRNRLAGFAGRPGVVLVADGDDGEPVAMTGIGHSQEPGDTMLWGMWVRPAARRLGAARALIDAAVNWAVADDRRTITLWVVATNQPARRLYEATGFTPTGRTDRRPSDLPVEEVELRRRVSDGA